VADRFGLHLSMKIEKGDTRLNMMESLDIHNNYGLKSHAGLSADDVLSLAQTSFLWLEACKLRRLGGLKQSEFRLVHYLVLLGV
jgi:hypothetical protein